MKIVFFDFATLNFGGGCEINFMNFGKWLKKEGHETAFVTATNALCNLYCFASRQGEHKDNISNDDLKNKLKVEKYLMFGIFDLFLPTKKQHNIMNLLNSADVVYSKNEIFEVLILRFIFRINPKKLVFGFHTPIYYPSARNLKSKLHNLLYNSGFYFKLINHAKVRCLVLSESERRILSKKSCSDIVVIPNPLNTKRFQRINYQKKDSFNIYYIGRMTEQKGVDTLALVIKSLASVEMFKKCNIFFIGNGDKESFLRDISNKYDNCFFFGFKSDVLKYYLDADLVIVPSRGESFCYTVAEAQSCGVPVLCSNIPGPKDIIIPNVTGWVVDVNDIQGFVDGIKKAYKIWIENFSSYRDIGILARANIIKNYEEEKINLKIEEFIFKK